MQALCISLLELRKNKYVADYQAQGAIYQQILEIFQQILKTQQASVNPDKVAVCMTLIGMNDNFQKVRTVFAPIIEMKSKGELNNNPNLVKKIEDTAAENIRIQKNVDSAARQFKCQ